MQKPGKMYLKVALESADICGFAVQQFLGENAYLGILPLVLVQMFHIGNDGICVSANHNFRDSGICISAGKPQAGKLIGKDPGSGIQIFQIPSPLESDGKGFCLHGIELI